MRGTRALLLLLPAVAVARFVVSVPEDGRPAATPEGGRPAATPEDGRPAATPEDGRPAATPVAEPAGKAHHSHLNTRPIIGILAQEKDGEAWGEGCPSTSSYIAASYVKSVEAAGARVVPVFIDQKPEYYEKLGNSLNGFLLPGGSANITLSTGYAGASDAIYRLVLAANARGSSLPLWGTCLGFEMLLLLAAAHRDPRSACDSYDRALPLNFSADWRSSQMFGEAPPGLVAALGATNLTSNFHHYCVTPQTVEELALDEHYTVLSTSVDDNGVEFVSSVEHQRFPVFGVQWHPEKNTFEWEYGSIPHSATAVAVERHVMEVFVKYARMNSNSFEDEEEEKKHLIYNYSPTYVHEDCGSKSFEQAYLF